MRVCQKAKCIFYDIQKKNRIFCLEKRIEPTNLTEKLALTLEEMFKNSLKIP